MLCAENNKLPLIVADDLVSYQQANGSLGGYTDEIL